MTVLFIPHLKKDGTKVLTASCDKTCKLWDLQSNQAIDIAQVSTYAGVHVTLIPYQLLLLA